MTSKERVLGALNHKETDRVPLMYRDIPEVRSRLKKEFGDVLTFSGGIDEQYILPNGTPQQVKDEVKRMIDIMGKNGGYILGPTHNFQDDIPTANIVAMYKAANEHCRFK